MKYNKIFLHISARIISIIVCVSLLLPTNAFALDLEVSDNGSGSESEVNVQSNTTTTVTQQNTAEIENNIETQSNTGDNSTSQNSGENTNVQTGNIVNQVNVENQVNYSSTSSGCCPQDTNAAISGNGSDSVNEININNTTTNNTSVNQTAKIKNNFNGVSNTGNNTADGNVGNVNIKTGDIKAIGGITNGPVNVANLYSTSGGGKFSGSISGNGYASVNLINSLSNNNHYSFNSAVADIQNNVYWDLNTGFNTADFNNSKVDILTGDIFLDFFVKNGPINFSKFVVECCAQQVDKESPKGPGKDDDKFQPEEEKKPGKDGKKEGQILPLAAFTEVGGPNILGLSDTDSAQAKTLFFWLGLIMVTAGIRYIAGETSLSSGKNTKR